MGLSGIACNLTQSKRQLRLMLSLNQSLSQFTDRSHNYVDLNQAEY